VETGRLADRKVNWEERVARAVMNLRAAFALALMLGAAGCDRGGAFTPPAQNAVPQGLLTIKVQSVPDYKAVAAILTNRDVGDARARIGGTLQRLLVREGEQVRRGQVLAIVLDRQLSLQAQAGSANVTAAEAAATRAGGDLARYKVLFDKGFISPSRMDQLSAESRAADAQLRAARAQAGAMFAASNEGRVVAPADGRVTRAPIPEGAVVLPGDVVVAISTGARVLRLELPEGEAGFLVQGQSISIVGEDDGSPARMAKVRQVYPAIANGRVTADLDAADFSGDFVGARVRVLVPTGERKAIVVPDKYIITRFGVDYVRLVRQNAGIKGGAIDIPVQRGARIPTPALPNGVEILSGLHDGDQILPPGVPA
jgi:RND family efflux transporter MFP subunit